MSPEIRILATTEEVRAGFAVFLRAMIGLPLPALDAVEITEPGRFLGAFDGPDVVAGADSYTSWMVVPGGARVPHAAVTHVGVLPTHRRGGIGGQLLVRQLHDAAARGEVVASLRASEAVIYEGFGYGVATSAQTTRVDRRRTRLRPGTPTGGELRLIDVRTATADLAHIADRASWVGAIARPAPWWTLRGLLRDAESTPHHGVVHRTDGVDDGFALYQPQDPAHWFGGTERTVRVTDLVALDDAARVALWHHLFALDLVDVLVLESLPVDDPLPLAVVDRRAVVPGSPRDETWLRLIDVEAALAARTYGAGDPVVLEVRDPILPGNEGRYAVGPSSVSRTDDAPDLVLDVATLAAVYLGGTRWVDLATTGRLTVLDPAAPARADRLFATGAAPFSGTAF